MSHLHISKSKISVLRWENHETELSGIWSSRINPPLITTETVKRRACGRKSSRTVASFPCSFHVPLLSLLISDLWCLEWICNSPRLITVDSHRTVAFADLLLLRRGLGTLSYLFPDYLPNCLLLIILNYHRLIWADISFIARLNYYEIS